MGGQKTNAVPLAISPLIKLARWSCLIAGVIYGFVRRRKYAAIENELRAEEEKGRAAREEFLAREKIRLNIAEMKELEKIFLGESLNEISKENDKLKDTEAVSNNNVTDH